MLNDIRISKLESTDEELILKIANWYFHEWVTPIEKTIARLSRLPNYDDLVQFVLWVNNESVASGALCNKVNLYTEHDRFMVHKPWVGFLFTEELHRGKGYGKLLLDELEKFSIDAGYSKIYLYTATAEALYTRCGWTAMERIKYKGQDTVVMEKILPSSPKKS